MEGLGLLLFPVWLPEWDNVVLWLSRTWHLCRKMIALRNFKKNLVCVRTLLFSLLSACFTNRTNAQTRGRITFFTTNISYNWKSYVIKGWGVLSSSSWVFVCDNWGCYFYDRRINSSNEEWCVPKADPGSAHWTPPLSPFNFVFS